MQTIRRFKNRLSAHGHGKREEPHHYRPADHGRSLSSAARPRKPRARSGMLLVETALSISLLTVLGLLLLKLCLNILHPRQWALQQTITDAYLTFERAAAERIPFDSLLGTTSPWPEYPNVSTHPVEFGRLPGGNPITGTVHRFRIGDPSNVPDSGPARTAALITNPAAISAWKVQSIVVYRIGNRTYSKSRTILRAQ